MLRSVMGYKPMLPATSPQLGGSQLALGGSETTTVSVPGARVGMPVIISPNNPSVGNGFQFIAYVSLDDVVTVKVFTILPGIPPVSTYNVKVVQ